MRTNSLCTPNRKPWRRLFPFLFTLAAAIRISLAVEVCDIAIVSFQGEPAALLRPSQQISHAHRGVTGAVEDFTKNGAGHLLFKGSQTYSEKTNTVHFHTAERARIVVAGETEELPELPKIELDLAVRTEPRPVSKRIVSLEGKVRWCPDLTSPVLAREQKAAETLNEGRKLVRTAVESSGYSPKGLAELALTNGLGLGVYQLPIIREATFDSSRICKPEEVLVNFTVAESGSASPQALILLVSIHGAP
jgi:hypothetical protein